MLWYPMIYLMRGLEEWGEGKVLEDHCLSVCPPQAGESRSVYFYFMTNIFNLSNIRKQYNKMLAVTAHHGPQKIKFWNTKSLFVWCRHNQPHRLLLGQNWIWTTGAFTTMNLLQVTSLQTTLLNTNWTRWSYSNDRLDVTFRRGSRIQESPMSIYIFRV